MCRGFSRPSLNQVASRPLSRRLSVALTLLLGIGLPACDNPPPVSAEPGDHSEPEPASDGTPESVVAANIAALPQASGAEIEIFTGGSTRLVWTRDTDAKPENPWQYSDSQQLMTLDSRDPRGCRSRLAEIASYGKPLLSPDGETIIFSRRASHEILALGFSEGEPVKLVDGFALEIWRDPADGRQWVYAGTAETGTRITAKVGSLFRFPLDAPTETEDLPGEFEVAVDSFQLSRDGATAGGLFPWPHGGLIRVGDGKWSRVRRGCWASMCPDDSYAFWVFDGGHHVPSFFDPVNRESWEVAFDTAPGFAGAEVYHPRWSNHPRIIALTGPYPKGVFHDLATGEVLLGRLTPDLRTIESWVRITRDDWPDGYPDVWIEGGDSTDSGLDQRRAEDLAQLTSDSGQWEKDRGGFVYRWAYDSGGESIYDSVSGEQVSCFVTPAGNAVFGFSHSMQLNGGGAFSTSEGFGKLIQHFCRIRKSVALEMMLSSDEGSDGGQIVCYGPSADSANFGLAQDGLDLEFTLHLSHEGGASGTTRKVGRIVPGRVHHLYVKFANGVLASYLDGELTHAEELDGQIADWTPAPLVFGNTPNGERPWAGTLWQVHAYDNPDLEPEIATHAVARLGEVVDLDRPPALTVRARIVETTPIPDPDSIGAYRRALIGNVYEVTEVIEGEFDAPRLAAFHWAILDRQAVPGAVREVGADFVLTLEPMANRPELKGERRFFDSEDFELQLFLDTGFP